MVLNGSNDHAHPLRLRIMFRRFLDDATIVSHESEDKVNGRVFARGRYYGGCRRPGLLWAFANGQRRSTDLANEAVPSNIRLTSRHELLLSKRSCGSSGRL
jgi:hypothetical protein